LDSGRGADRRGGGEAVLETLVPSELELSLAVDHDNAVALGRDLSPAPGLSQPGR
jgi:hypothetical protein